MPDNSPPDTSDSSPPDTSVDDGVRHTWSFVRANKKNRQDPELAKCSDEITKYLRDVCYPKIAQWEASKGDKDKRTRKDYIEQTIYPDIDEKFDISGPNGFKIQDFQDKETRVSYRIQLQLCTTPTSLLYSSTVGPPRVCRKTAKDMFRKENKEEISRDAKAENKGATREFRDALELTTFGHLLEERVWSEAGRQVLLFRANACVQPDGTIKFRRVSIYEGKTKGDFKPLDDGEVIAFKDWATSKLSTHNADGGDLPETSLDMDDLLTLPPEEPLALDAELKLTALPVAPAHTKTANETKTTPKTFPRAGSIVLDDDELGIDGGEGGLAPPTPPTPPVAGQGGLAPPLPPTPPVTGAEGGLAPSPPPTPPVTGEGGLAPPLPPTPPVTSAEGGLAPPRPSTPPVTGAEGGLAPSPPPVTGEGGPVSSDVPVLPPAAARKRGRPPRAVPPTVAIDNEVTPSTPALKKRGRPPKKASGAAEKGKAPAKKLSGAAAKRKAPDTGADAAPTANKRQRVVVIPEGGFRRSTREGRGENNAPRLNLQSSLPKISEYHRGRGQGRGMHNECDVHTGEHLRGTFKHNNPGRIHNNPGKWSQVNRDVLESIPGCSKLRAQNDRNSWDYALREREWVNRVSRCRSESYLWWMPVVDLVTFLLQQPPLL
ncbi:hypothetical protein B0H13DRAFT_1856232 [Mycena leptocephala]|nr:hypothetical protein B0H13DRAFT_1856232 [Mycena leptocephala]